MAGSQLRDHDKVFERSVFNVIERTQVDYVVLLASMVEVVQRLDAVVHI